MPKSRANGEGTGPYWSEARKKWVVQLPAGADGSRPLRTGDTQAEALALKKQLEAERAAGRDLARKAETVESLCEYAREVEQDHVTASTIRGYRNKDRHVTKRIGAMKLKEVDTTTIQRLANRMAADGVSAGYVRAILERLSGIFELAIPEKITYNPVNWKKLRLLPAEEGERLPAEDAVALAILLAADDIEAQGGDIRYAIAWYLAALLGLRRGEIAALSWRDVNWERNEIRVWRTYAPDDAGSFKLGPTTKNKRERILPFGPRLRARLWQQWELHQLDRRRSTWKEHGFVVCDEQGAPIVQLTRLNDKLMRLCKNAKLPHTTPHQLRHTVATLLDEEGVSGAVISAILGHSRKGKVKDDDEQMSRATRGYIHARENPKRDAVLVIERRLFSPSQELLEGAK